MSYLFVLTSVVIVMSAFVFVVIWGESPGFVAILVHGGVLMYRSNLEASSIAPMSKSSTHKPLASKAQSLFIDMSRDVTPLKCNSHHKH